MARSYGTSIPSFFLNGNCGGILQNLAQKIIQQIPSVSISYETIDISATSNPNNPLGRLYLNELNSVRLKYGFLAVYPTALEVATVNDVDIVFSGNNLLNADYFYVYNNQGYIPTIINSNVFKVAYRAKGASLNYSQYVNNHSILCMITDCGNNEDDILELVYYFSDEKLIP